MGTFDYSCLQKKDFELSLGGQFDTIFHAIPKCQILLKYVQTFYIQTSSYTWDNKTYLP
jgi:hypothetical protein